MLAGLLFAIEEASAPSGRLVATLPFAGTTLIEHQARQLIAAGAGQIVVVADAFDGELRGALHRIGRRGVAVDPVQGLGEAAATLHPLSRIVMLADGLVAADATVHALADGGEAGDALLTLAGGDAPPGFERIGGGGAWAGVARLSPQRLADAGALPADYAPQSTLLHVVEAAGAARVELTRATLDDGHGVEREAGAMERRGRRLVAAAVAARHGWFDRAIAGPLTRAAMPALAAAGVSAAAVLAAIAGVAALAAVALIGGWPRIGLVLALVATAACPLATALAMLREERAVGIGADVAAAAIPALAILLLARGVALASNGAAAWVIAVALVISAGLAMRAVRRPHGWWGSPPAYLTVIAAIMLAGWPGAALAVGWAYATATLAAAIEALRRPRHA